MKGGLSCVILSGCAAAVTLVCGCGKPRENITMAGSTAFQPFAEKLADQYMTTHADVTVTVQGGGSALGIQSALSGRLRLASPIWSRFPMKRKR